MQRAQRNYTDDERAAALAAVRASGGNVAAAARACGFPVRSIRRWLKETPAVVSALAEEKAADLAVRLDAIAYKAAGIQAKLLDHCDADENLDVALDHWSDINRAMGTSIDKAALLSGEPTERIEHIVDLDLSHGD